MFEDEMFRMASMNSVVLELPSPPPGKNGWPWVSEPSLNEPQLYAGQGWPKISIVTPSYNQGPYLEKTIRSVLSQGYPNLEYIIIDGGSSDNSVEIIKKYEPWLTYWVSEKDRGQSHAINKGFERSTGELLGWLNSDDWHTKKALRTIALAYIEDQSFGAIYGQGKIVDEKNRVTHTPRLVPVDKDKLLDWATGNDFMQPSCFFTRESWSRCGPLDETLIFSLDVDLWLKISNLYQYKKVDEVLSFSLTHSEAKTTASRNAMYADLAIVLMRHGGERQARDILNSFITRLDELDIIEKLFNIIAARKLFKKIRNYFL